MQISVIIPTRNRPVLLKRAIDSIDKQGIPAEIVIIDNASEEPIRPDQYNGNFSVKVIRNAIIRSAAQNRNAGVQAASGDVNCFLDDDDEYLPGKFKSVLHHLSQDSTLDFVYAGTQMKGPEGELLGIANGSCQIREYLFWRFMHCNSMAIRRSVFERISFNEEMKTYEDAEFAGRLIKEFRGGHIDEEHAIWYRDGRPDQLTKRNLRRSKPNWQILCDTFEDEINSDSELRKLYYHKMILLCLYCLDLRGAAKYSLARIFPTKRYNC